MLVFGSRQRITAIFTITAMNASRLSSRLRLSKPREIGDRPDRLRILDPALSKRRGDLREPGHDADFAQDHREKSSPLPQIAWSRAKVSQGSDGRAGTMRAARCS